MKKHHLAWLTKSPHRTAEWLAEMLAHGFEVHHIDSNHDNDDPANLVLIERIDHGMLHGHTRIAVKKDQMREWGRLGGLARKAKLSPAKRRAIARKGGKASVAKRRRERVRCPNEKNM